MYTVVIRRRAMKDLASYTKRLRSSHYAAYRWIRAESISTRCQKITG
jgi:hypothetical protein